MYPTLVTWLTTLTVVGASALVVSALCALAAAGLGPRNRRETESRESRDILRISRRFADLVAAGDLDAADAAASDAFDGPMCSRVVEWNERAVLDVSIREARRELTETAPAATWFPDARRVPRGDAVELILGREEPIHLTIVSEDWTSDLDGLMVEASYGAFSIKGSLSLRTVMARDELSALRTAVEVLIHMEAVDVPETRRALARARLITHDGLARMAATLNTG